MNDMPWIKSYAAGVRWDLNIRPMAVQHCSTTPPPGRTIRPCSSWAGAPATANCGLAGLIVMLAVRPYKE